MSDTVSMFSYLLQLKIGYQYVNIPILNVMSDLSWGNEQNFHTHLGLKWITLRSVMVSVYQAEQNLTQN